MIKLWKGKRTDIFLMILYFIIYGAGIHILTSVRRALKHDEDIFEALKNPGNLFLTLLLMFIFIAPIGLYFRLVPKLVKLNSEDRKLEIHKKRRILRYNIDKIRFYKRNIGIFCVLEIHATFESSKQVPFEKLATSIMVPNWGLSWNKQKIEEIVHELKALNIEEIESRPHVSISEYFYN